MLSQLLPMARGLLMLSPLLMLLMLIMDMDITLVMPTMDTLDTHMPTTMDTTMARGLLMLSPLLMLPMLIMDMDITLAMPTMDTMDTHMPTVDTSMDKMDIIINLFVKNLGFSSVKLVTPSHIDHC